RVLALAHAAPDAEGDEREREERELEAMGADPVVDREERVGEHVAEHPDGHDPGDGSADVEHDEDPDAHLGRAREQTDPLVRNEGDSDVTRAGEEAFEPEHDERARTELAFHPADGDVAVAPPEPIEEW